MGRVCREQECNWWCLCCNKWLCWRVWIVVRIVVWVIVTVGKWVTRIVDQPSNCNVSMRFNFTIGAIALLAAALIGHFLFGR